MRRIELVTNFELKTYNIKSELKPSGLNNQSCLKN